MIKCHKRTYYFALYETRTIAPFTNEDADFITHAFYIDLKICNRNNFIMLYAAKKRKSGVVNSESSSHETDATRKNASGLDLDDEHG